MINALLDEPDAAGVVTKPIPGVVFPPAGPAPVAAPKKADASPPAKGAKTEQQPTKAQEKPPEKKPETLDHALVRMYEDGYSLAQIVGQIRRWHPDWSAAQIAEAATKAARVFYGLAPSKGSGKDVVSQALRDLAHTPKATATMLLDVAVTTAHVGGKPVANAKSQAKAKENLAAARASVEMTLAHPLRDPFATAMLLAPLGRAALSPALRETYDAAVSKLSPAEKKQLLAGADPKKFRYTEDQKRTVAKLYDKIGEQGARDYQGKPYPSTAEHAHGVAEKAAGTAKELGYSKQQQKVVFGATVPHDVGKGSSATIRRLVKEPRKLEGHETAIVAQHTVRGERLLKRLGIDDPHTLAVAREHHDPAGPIPPLSSKPPITKIVQVADIYDAMIRPRAYERDFPFKGGQPTGRTYLTQAEAFAELDDLVAVGKLDGEAVAALKRFVAKSTVGVPKNAAAVAVVVSPAVTVPNR